ncbi:RagB/SusD family nutrient uptake outer membrane protein [Marinifilum breve]|uniref:RagB/SusD family nutrient uptake outer membrane protein n=2 Tax=Marinifilum breve TaxID=2184082 RepID=A0A2V4A0G6_9BACT|nr:RagB/SusD family nutrient uptake outer membrane protein [Marinifilum breve]
MNLKGTYILSAVLLVASGLFHTSCSDDFLEIDPQVTQTPEDYFSSSTDAATEVVNAVYNNLLQWDQHSFSWNGVSSITSDDADKGSDPGDTGADKHELDNFTFSASSVSFNEIWVANYRGISFANQALDIIPGLEIEDVLKKRLEGEAKFLRAYYYWNLVRCFGGVPKIDKIPDPANAEDITNGRTRASKEDIYKLIISDLQFGIENLQERSAMNSSDLGRATKGAAKTFLAKVYMYQKNWDEAFKLTNEVIQSGEYSLVADYAQIWRESGENSSESIFEVQASGTTPNKGIQGYVAHQGVRGQLGWGFNTPSKDLEDTYEAADPRKDATIIFPGETMWDGVEINASTPNPRYNEKAYISKTMETFNGNDWESNKNIRIFRYAEVLLINAEAANELGQTANALTSLNQVRNRVGLTDATSDNLKEKIWHERRIELAMEHDRFFDLVRQGRAGEVLRAHGKSFVDGKHEVFPIPQTQIELSGGILTQNPGY